MRKIRNILQGLRSVCSINQDNNDYNKVTREEYEILKKTLIDLKEQVEKLKQKFDDK